MMSLYPGVGMGAAGTGMGAGVQVPPGAGLTPQMLAMMAQAQGGGGVPGGFTPPTGPTQSPMTGTPMAGYIGAGGNPAGMAQNNMPPPPQGVPPGAQAPGGLSSPMAGPIQALQQQQQLQQLLSQMKQGQIGVSPNGSMLQNLMNYFQGGLPGSQNPQGVNGMASGMSAGGFT